MPDPVPLEDVLISLASSFVFVREQLERTQELLEPQPADQPEQTLRPRVRLQISDVEVEVNYVVSDTGTRTPVSVQATYTRKLPLFTVNQIDSLKRGADFATPVLDQLIADYDTAKDELARLAAMGQIPEGEQIKRTPRVTLTPESIQILERGAARDAVRKFRQIVEDYTTTKNELDRLARLVRPARPSMSLNVRVDTEALGEASTTAQHKIKFRLQTRDTEIVTVDDQRIELQG